MMFNTLPVDIVNIFFDEYLPIYSCIELSKTSPIFYKRYEEKLKIFSMCRKDFFFFHKELFYNQYLLKKEFINKNKFLINFDYYFKLNSHINLYNYATKVELNYETIISIGSKIKNFKGRNINNYPILFCNGKNCVRQVHNIMDNNNEIKVNVLLKSDGSGIVSDINDVTILHRVLNQVIDALQSHSSFLCSNKALGLQTLFLSKFSIRNRFFTSGAKYMISKYFASGINHNYSYDRRGTTITYRTDILPKEIQPYKLNKFVDTTKFSFYVFNDNEIIFENIDHIDQLIQIWYFILVGLS